MYCKNAGCFMSARRRRNKLSFNDLKRAAIVVSWVAMVAVVLFVLLRHLAVDELDDQRKRASAEYVAELQVVKLPDGLPDKRLAYRGFTVHFNPELHIPNCVVYELTASETEGSVPRFGSFETDSAVAGCANPWDYTLSGYDRGHMIPAGDLRWDSLAMRESFKMTNVCPQTRALNSGGWTKIEDKIREWAVRDSVLIVVTGPVITRGMKTIGDSHVAVPTAFFKVVLAPFATPMRAIGFVMPNKAANGPLKKYVVSVDEVERRTGMDFFSALPDDIENGIESQLNLSVWTH